jgi:hypothetical protein
MTLLRYTMLPAPARIAAPPSVTSRVSWKPAVPPPPVSGAAVGKALGDWFGVDGELGDLLADPPPWLPAADALAVAVDCPFGVAVPVCCPAGVAVPVGCPVGLALPVPVGVPPGAKGVGVPEGVPPVQAETDADASTTAHPIAINLPLSRVPAMTERIFLAPPDASAGA